MNTLPRNSNFPSPLIVLTVVASFLLVLVFMLLQRHLDHVAGYCNRSHLQRDTAIRLAVQQHFLTSFPPLYQHDLPPPLTGNEGRKLQQMDESGAIFLEMLQLLFVKTMARENYSIYGICHQSIFNP